MNTSQLAEALEVNQVSCFDHWVHDLKHMVCVIYSSILSTYNVQYHQPEWSFSTTAWPSPAHPSVRSDIHQYSPSSSNRAVRWFHYKTSRQAWHPTLPSFPCLLFVGVTLTIGIWVCIDKWIPNRACNNEQVWQKTYLVQTPWPRSPALRDFSFFLSRTF